MWRYIIYINTDLKGRTRAQLPQKMGVCESLLQGGYRDARMCVYIIYIHTDLTCRFYTACMEVWRL